MENKILFVDDELDILELFLILFREYRDSILVASSGDEAIELLKRNSVSLIISDISMNKGSGQKLLEYVKQNHPGVEFYFHSAMECKSTQDPFVQGTLKKPTSMDSFEVLFFKHKKK